MSLLCRIFLLLTAAARLDGCFDGFHVFELDDLAFHTHSLFALSPSP